MANTINGIMVKKFKNKIKLYYVNNIFDGLKKKIVLEKNNFFLTSNLIIYSKFKKLNNFYYSHDFINNNEVQKFYVNNINDWHKTLYNIDSSINSLLLKEKLKFNKNFYISSYVFRYFAFQEYSKIILLKKCIKRFSKKNKTEKIIFLGKFELKYFSDKFVVKYLNTYFSQEISCNNHFINQKKLKLKSKLKIRINKKNLFLFFQLSKKKFLNSLSQIFKKPSSLFLTYQRELLYDENSSFYNLNNIHVRKNGELNTNFDKKIILKNIKIPKIFSDHITSQALELFKNNYNLIEQFNEKFKKLKIINLSYDIEDTDIKSYFAIHVAKMLNLKTTGYQHGSDYGVTPGRDIDHNYLCYRFADEYIIWGFSKFFDKKKKNIYLKDIKFINKGSLSGKFLKNILNFKMGTDNKKIMYVPSIVRTDFMNAKSVQDPNWQIQLQNKIVNFLVKRNLNETFLSLPSFSYEYCLNYFPIAFDKKIQKLKMLEGSFKDNLLECKPKVLIFDNFSTPLYESLNTNCKIIVFIDPLNIPKKDVLLKLNKRVEIIYSTKNMDIILNKKLNEKIFKKNNEFKNSFYYN